jgi:hypothetical protein
MTQPQRFPFKRPDPHTPPGLESRAGELRASLEQIPAETLASRAGVSYLSIGPGRGEFHFNLFDKSVVGAFPNLTFFTPAGDKLPDFQQALLLYYFVVADGAPLTGQWVSFADLPGGRMYNQAFQGYSGDVVRNFISNDLSRFKTACLALGGQPLDLGSASFTFPALPRVPLLITFWLGDEDFPSSCKVLFDASATHYLPIDGCAILGSQLTGKIVKRLQSASHQTG